MKQKNLLLFAALVAANAALEELELTGQSMGIVNTPYYVSRHRALVKDFENAQQAIEDEESEPVRKVVIHEEKPFIENEIEREVVFAPRPERRSIRLNEILNIFNEAKRTSSIDFRNVVLVSPRNFQFAPKVTQWLTRTFDITVE